MRLINTRTESLEEFVSHRDIGPYAILSHTWGDGEVTFQEMSSPQVSELLYTTGYTKIREACRIARIQEIDYIWVDTCCIDKTSSAELTEAINSMFRWYAGSQVCFAFLEDVQKSLDPRGADASLESQIEKCRWLTRGWTLQELIAPSHLEFYDKFFNCIGSKTDHGDLLERITGINKDILNGRTPLSQIAVAKRMSWAAKRNTTRLEDSAYCLLGIFNVNMPLVYGEGEGAFQRLQEEIIKESNDLSLFAWCANTTSQYRGLLANSSFEYSDCSNVHIDNDMFLDNPEYSVTNKGIKMHTDLIGSVDGAFFLDLRCYQMESSKETILISLRQIHNGVFLRENPASFTSPTLAKDKSKGYFEANMKFYARKSIEESLSRTLVQYRSTPFIFREGFTEFGEQENQSEMQEFTMSTTWYASTYCLNHQYNRERTLRPVFPRYGKATILFSITTCSSDRSVTDNRLFEQHNLYVWIGVNEHNYPWIYCSFEDKPAFSKITTLKEQIDKDKPLGSSAQTRLLSLNPKSQFESLRETRSQLSNKPLAAIHTDRYNTGHPANFYVRLELVSGSIDNKDVFFIDLTSVDRTRVPRQI